MKDRIKQIMESQHMTQQVFANFIDVSPASLSSIFNDRTRPTLNIVEAIKKKIPSLNTDWLMFGTGEMYTPGTPPRDNVEHGVRSEESGEDNSSMAGMEMAINFDSGDYAGAASTLSPHKHAPQNQYPSNNNYNSVRNTPDNQQRDVRKNIDIKQRHITEIRVYFDDQTYETFVPSKK